jgi:ABC transporter with metal-binding/Fe-S-binding domain ATP-binding protein
MKPGVALVSGGKDSIYALIKSLEEGMRVKGIVTVIPPPGDMMFHHPCVELVELQAEALRIPWIPVKYKEGIGYPDFLKEVLAELEGIHWVVAGAIASRFQRKILEEACGGCHLTLYNPLWGLGQDRLLEKYIKYGMEILITSVSAHGLGEDWLGRVLDERSIRELLRLSRHYGFNPSGEGGEFETLVLDAPAFTKRVRVLEDERMWRGDHGFITIKEAQLEEKIPRRLG